MDGIFFDSHVGTRVFFFGKLNDAAYPKKEKMYGVISARQSIPTANLIPASPGN